MNCHSFWRYVFLCFHLLTIFGIMLVLSAMSPSSSGARIGEIELKDQLATKTLYSDNVNWILSTNPEITIIDNQIIGGYNVVFYEVKDTKNIKLSEPKFSAKEDDRNDNVLVKMRAFCKSMAEKVKGRMIVTKTSVIDLKISE